MKFHKICFLTMIPNFYKISSPRHGPCERHYNTCNSQAFCGPRRAEIAKFMKIGEFSRNSCFFGENHQKSGIFMEFHENGIKSAEFAISELQKHQFRLVIPCPNQASAPGGRKVPRTTKIHPILQKFQENGCNPTEIHYNW